MSTLVIRELIIDYDNASTYLTADMTNMQLPYSSTSSSRPSTAIGIVPSSSLALATATLNSAAKDILFPSETAIIQSAEVGVASAYKYNGSVGEDNTAYVDINDTKYAELILTNNPVDHHQGILSVLTDKNNTTLKCCLTKDNSKTGGGSGVSVGSNYTFKLTFKQVSCYGAILTAGIQSIDVSNYMPYVGDTVTFKANLVNENVTFYGWSTAMDGSQIISQDLEYTTTVTDDLILYALSDSNPMPTTNYETLEGHPMFAMDGNPTSYWRTSNNQVEGSYLEFLFYQPVFFIGVEAESFTFPLECFSSNTALQITTDGGQTWQTVGKFNGEPSCTVVGIHKDGVNGIRFYAETSSNMPLCINELIMYFSMQRPVCNAIKAVYKKINGAWVVWTDMLTLFDSGKIFTT